MTNVHRPTPAEPMPAAATQDQAQTTNIRTLPPGLGSDAVSVFEASAFMVGNAAGDVPKGSTGGLVHDDTRILNRWELTINHAHLKVLLSDTVDSYSASFFLTNPDLPGLPADTIGVRRQRFLACAGLHERIQVQSFTERPLSIELRQSVGVDFADLFEMKDVVRDRSQEITRSHASDGSLLKFSYRNGRFEAQALVQADPAAGLVEGDDLVWDLRLEPRGEWQCELTVPLHGGEEVDSKHRQFGDSPAQDQNEAMAHWLAYLPVLEADSELVRESRQKSIVDLAALRIEKRPRDWSIVLPAAGMPWFLTLFGRDTLITPLQTVSYGHRLAHGALLALASLQGTKVDDFRDEEPGKILHEFRMGELTVLGERPQNPYYGAADSTALWLILLSEYWRWTLDDDCVRSLRDNVYAALRWIDEYGDRDGDGYIEYATRSRQGLGNHCWRDSWNGVLFADGSMPVLPIATCEIQGYTYDAKLRLAELAAGPLGDPELARRLPAEADALRERFNRDFWIDERGGYYALGLDGDKRKIDSMTSNMGQLLWSGIVPPDRAPIVVGHLMSNEMFSGWGVRTTSTSDGGYNPIGYHMGTVWPHDNSLIAYGLARYGYRDEANRIIVAMLEAAKYSNYRLPEALAGYDRTVGRLPVPYPSACSPQAWASGAPLLFLRTMLGLEARNGHLIANPNIPPEFGRIRLFGTNAFGKRWDVDATGDRYELRLASPDNRDHSGSKAN
jgi:glycogen debranching enzyme